MKKIAKKISYKTMCLTANQAFWLCGVCQDADIKAVFGYSDGFLLHHIGTFLECFSADLYNALLEGKTIKVRIYADSLAKYKRSVNHVHD